MIATRDRVAELLSTLGRLAALPERPPVIVVDNGSSDGTPDAVAQQRPEVQVVGLRRNRGAAARTIGALRAETPYVAFSDDDSWWAPGSLRRASDILDAHPDVALLAARILVGPEERRDPICDLMAASPLPADPLQPGPSILGFVACAAVVRRGPFLAVGGFEPHLGIGGEEQLLALDLAADGWRLVYADQLIAHHHPSASRDPAARRRHIARNALWTAWLRRPPSVAAARTIAAARAAVRDADAREALGQALAGVGWVRRRRRLLPTGVEAALRRLESAAAAARTAEERPSALDGR